MYGYVYHILFDFPCLLKRIINHYLISKSLLLPILDLAIIFSIWIAIDYELLKSTVLKI